MKVVYKRTAIQKVVDIVEEIYSKGGEVALGKIDFIAGTQADVDELWRESTFRDKDKWYGFIRLPTSGLNCLTIGVAVRAVE